MTALLDSYLPAAARTKHVGILGMTGAGKTHTGKWLVEQRVAAGERICFLDPIKSDAWGLISSASGKSAGLPFQILGGPRAHVPLPPLSGSAVAELVGSGALPLSIIDMEAFTPEEHAKWYIAFAETLLRKVTGVVTLVMEEADMFAPKDRLGGGGEKSKENMRLYWSSRIARTGRSKGVRLMALCTRTQKLHNDLLGSCSTLIAHRFSTPADRKPIIEWLSLHAEPKIVKEIEGTLSGLADGEAWVCYPPGNFIKRVQFPKISTYDNSATPTGDESVADVRTAPVDKDKLRALLGEAVKEAEANDPELLKKRIKELEGDVARAKHAPPVQLDVTTIRLNEELILDIKNERDRLRRDNQVLATTVKTVSSVLRVEAVNLKERGEGLARSLAEITAPEEEPRSIRLPTPALSVPPTMKVTTRPAAAVSNGDATALEGPHRKILGALAWWLAVGIDRPSRAQVAAVANYAPNGGSYGRYLSTLKSGGYIDYPDSGSMAITPAGTAVAEHPTTAPTVAELHGRALNIASLKGPHRKILKVLLDAGGRELGRTDVAERSGYEATGGSFGRYMSHLSSAGLIRYPKRTTVAPAAWLFPEGLQ